MFSKLKSKSLSLLAEFLNIKNKGVLYAGNKSEKIVNILEVRGVKSIRKIKNYKFQLNYRKIITKRIIQIFKAISESWKRLSCKQSFIKFEYNPKHNIISSIKTKSRHESCNNELDIDTVQLIVK